MTKMRKSVPGHGPARAVLAAAVLAAALAATAYAANAGGLDKLFNLFRTTFTIQMQDGEGTVMSLDIPTVSVDKTEDARVLLTVDEEELDITDALAEDGCYLWQKENEAGGSTEIEVRADGSAELRCYDADGKQLMKYEHPTPEETVMEVSGGADAYVICVNEPSLDSETEESSVIVKTPASEDSDTAGEDGDEGFGLETDDLPAAEADQTP